MVQPIPQTAAAPNPYAGQVRASTVFAQYEKPLLARTTRWDYVKSYIPLWKEAMTFELYSYILAAVGIYFLAFQFIPAIAAAAGFGFFYYRVLRQQRVSRLVSTRKVIWGH